MPIVIDQGAPAITGLAAYAVGKNKYLRNQQQQMLPYIRQMEALRYQRAEDQERMRQRWGLQQQEQQFMLQRDDQRQQNAFQRQQEVSNAEARARGEPLPFPDFNAGGNQPQLQRRPDGALVGTFPEPTARGSGIAIDPNADGTPGPMTPFQRTKYFADEKRRYDEGVAAKKAEDETIAGLRKDVVDGKRVFVGAAANKWAEYNSERAKMELNPGLDEAAKDEARRKFDAQERKLLRLAQEKPEGTPEGHWDKNVRSAMPDGTLVPKGTPGSVPVVVNPKTGMPERIDLKDKEVETPTQKRAIERERDFRKEDHDLQKDIDNAQIAIQDRIDDLTEMKDDNNKTKSKYSKEQIDAKVASRKAVLESLQARQKELRDAHAKAQAADGAGASFGPTAPQQSPPAQAPSPQQANPPLPNAWGHNPLLAPPTQVAATQTPYWQPKTAPMEAPTRPASAPVPVQTQADIQGLPHGTEWVAPDGQTGRVEKTMPVPDEKPGFWGGTGSRIAGMIPHDPTGGMGGRVSAPSAAPQPQAAQVASPQSRAEFDALPPGTPYRLPDGREGVK